MERPESATSEQAIEVVDLSGIRERNRALLRAARRVFGDAAHTVAVPQDSRLPCRLLNAQGSPVAYCWMSDKGQPQFKPWCDHHSN